VLKSLHVENFKNLADVEAEFGSINAIIGPNGCGKSSLLQAIDFLRAFFYPSIEDYLREKGYDYSDLPNLRRAGKAIRWKLRAQLGPDSKGQCAGEYEYEVTARRWRYLGVGEEKLSYTSQAGEKVLLFDRAGRKIKGFGDDAVPHHDLALVNVPRSLMADIDPKLKARYPQMWRFHEWITSFRSFLIWDPKVLRRADRGKHEELGQSGEHLAPVLANLRRADPEKFAKVVARIKRLFPTVTDIAIRGPRTWGWQEISLIEGDGRNVSFNSQQMSDGVLRLLAICTFLYADKVPQVLMFEEPENGIHPQLIGEVIQILRELTLRKPPSECQVLFTTHSPYVLDELYDHPDQVYVMERGRPQQGASLYRLSDRQDVDLVKALFKHSLGEAWFSGLIGGTAKGTGQWARPRSA